jgi:hypothetical protein
MDVWFCGMSVEADSYPWWEAHMIAERFDPWMRHPYALVLYVMVVIFLFSSGIVFSLIEIAWMISVVLTAGGLMLLSALLH